MNTFNDFFFSIKTNVHMKIVNRIAQLFHNPLTVASALLYLFSNYIKNDEWYVKARYYTYTGKKLNLDNPQTFNEKINWLKLYNRNPLYTQMVDKIEAKRFVANIIGEKYIIPTLGIWEHPEEIDFDSLPNQFVIKCNHNSSVCICKDKSMADIDKIRKSLTKGLKQDYYVKDREWPYKDVNRRIIAEKFMSDEKNKDLADYKFFCFNGMPKYCQVIKDRSTKETIDFFDMNWNHQLFIGLNPSVKNAKQAPTCPAKFDEMKEIATKLAQGLPFSRIDLYEIKGNVFFGEITFFPGSGRGTFRPEKWNDIFGSWIKLPERKTK